MTTTLYLCEKPSQAKEVAEALGIKNKTDGAYRGAGVIVTNAIGHLLEQAEPEAYGEQFAKWTLESLPCIPDPWQNVLKTATKAQYTVIKGLLKEADRVVIATDADREGEVIARNILAQAGYTKPIQRLWVQETTPSGYKKGYSNLKDGASYESLYASGVGRGHADWLSGMNLTRALTVAFSTGGKGNTLHFGRVQTPTLALIVRRERAIKNFKPSDYFNIKGEFIINGQSVKMAFKPDEQWLDAAGRISSFSKAETITIILNSVRVKNEFKVSHYETKEEREAAPLPYYLGSLQKECARIFGMRPDRVLEVCQTLYDTHKLISYPRGEGEHIPEQIFEESKTRLDALQSIDPSLANFCAMADLSKPSRAFNDAAVAKAGSHFAIIPTDKDNFNINSLSGDEAQVYDLIRRRYIAQFLGHYVFDKTTLEVSHGLGTSQPFTFAVIGRTPKIEGWKRVYGVNAKKIANDEKAETEAEVTLPKTQKGADAPLKNTICEKAQTKPPARYSNATLITAMESIDKEIDDPRLAAVMKGKEKAGIGTNATRAEVIKKLYDGDYIADQKKQLMPTEKGVALIELLEKVCPALADLALTAMWEEQLSQVENGELDVLKFERAVGKFITVCIEQIKAAAGTASIGTIAHPCPACGKAMSRRKNEKGFWWGCSGYPTCKSTMGDKGGKPVAIVKAAPATPSAEHKCSKCQKPLIRRKGTKGFWWGCSGYPTCKEMYKDKLGKPTK